MKKFKKILGILAAVVVVIMIGSNIKLTTVQTHKQEQKQLQEEQLSGDGIQEEIIEMTEPQMQIGEEQTKEEPAKQEKNKKKKTEHISDKKANGEEKKKDITKIEEKSKKVKKQNKEQENNATVDQKKKTESKSRKKSTQKTEKTDYAQNNDSVNAQVASSETVTTEKKEEKSANIEEKVAEEGNANPQTNDAEKTVATAKPTVTEKADKKTIVCSVAIDCSSLLNHMDELEENIKPFVPADGAILKKMEITMEVGESAYDCLAKACKSNNIAIDAEYTAVYSGYYVKGVGYLYEKIAGRMSGWLYQVNGKTPNVGASSYTLKEGDEVKWIYTCSGRVGS